MDIIELVKRYEGFHSTVYICPAGKRTIGHGHNLDAEPLFEKGSIAKPLHYVDLDRAEGILVRDLLRAAEAYQQLFTDLPNILDKGVLLGLTARQAAIIDMIFNLGFGGFLKFKRVIEAYKVGDYAGAAQAMKDSKWFNQVKRRAYTDCYMMQTGTFPDKILEQEAA